MKNELANIDIPPRVVFLNLKDSKVFFDCSPAEARAAITEVERFRECKITMPELRQNVEKMKFMVNSFTGKSKTVIGDPKYITIDNLSKSFVFIEKQDLHVDGIFMNSTNFADVRNWGKTIYDEATENENNIGIFAHVWKANIVIDNKIKTGFIYLVSLGSFNKNPCVVKVKFNAPKKCG